MQVIDLFCGIGGLSSGLNNSGLEIVAGADADHTCRFAFQENLGATFISSDIRGLNATGLKKFFKKRTKKVLVGCAPCQTFSSHFYKNRTTKKNDEKWHLLDDFASLIEIIEPHVVSMENVVNLKRYDIFNSFTRTLKTNGFHVSFQSVDCRKYGIPQTRRRLVLLASRLGPIELIKGEYSAQNYRTVRDTISHLPPINAGEASNEDPLHCTRKLSSMNLERIKQSKPGGTWKDWDKHLICKCHRKATGKSYKSVYGRMEWDKPSPTITGQFVNYGTGRFGHPEQNRAISLREGALLQTFPMNFKFHDSGTSLGIERLANQIGNAVPVLLGEAIGKSIRTHLEE